MASSAADQTGGYATPPNPLPLKPPIPYFGGKARIAPWLVSLMPAHRVYVEPFAGSAAVMFAKARATHEILNDVDGEVVNFFRVLRERREDLELACRLTPYSREEFAAAANREDLDDLERARRWFVRVSQSVVKTGIGSTGWATSILRSSNNARTVWNRMGRFADVADRLGGVSIERRDALEVIREYSAIDALIYVDPPYLTTTRTSLTKRPGGDYSHEFDTEADHRALAEVLHESPAMVLLSGYASPLYEDLYGDWQRIDRRVVSGMRNGRGSAKPWATESVWANYRLAVDDGLWSTESEAEAVSADVG